MIVFSEGEPWSSWLWLCVFSFSLLFFLLPSVCEHGNSKRKHFFYKFAAQLVLPLSFSWRVHSFSQSHYILLFGIFLLENELFQYVNTKTKQNETKQKPNQTNKNQTDKKNPKNKSSTPPPSNKQKTPKQFLKTHQRNPKTNKKGWQRQFWPWVYVLHGSIKNEYKCQM